MQSEKFDNVREPRTEEFEKLEFLPEQPVPDARSAGEDTGKLIFSPELERHEDPPVSYDPAADPAGQPDIDFFGRTAGDVELGVSTPFELVGTSIFEDIGDISPDEEEFPSYDLDDDLEF